MRFLLLRDLGIKDKVREVREFAKDNSAKCENWQGWPQKGK